MRAVTVWGACLADLPSLVDWWERCDSEADAFAAMMWVCDNKTTVSDLIHEETDIKTINRCRKAISKIHARANKWLFAA